LVCVVHTASIHRRRPMVCTTVPSLPGILEAL
jgi:hypothetical protein